MCGFQPAELVDSSLELQKCCNQVICKVAVTFSCSIIFCISACFCCANIAGFCFTSVQKMM